MCSKSGCVCGAESAVESCGVVELSGSAWRVMGMMRWSVGGRGSLSRARGTVGDGEAPGCALWVALARLLATPNRSLWKAQEGVH